MGLGKKLIAKQVLLPSFILPFSFYLMTTCPSVYLGDSGELTAAAFSIGIPHNSGYPLYCLVGKFFCLLPIGNIGFRMNLMSCFFSAAAVCLVVAFVLRLTASRIAALTAGLALAFTPLLWSQATCAEVYSLHAFLVILMITLLRWWDESQRTLSLASLCSCDRLEFWQPYANHDAGSSGFLHHSFRRQEGSFGFEASFVHHDLLCFRAAYLHLLAY